MISPFFSIFLSPFLFSFFQTATTLDNSNSHSNNNNNNNNNINSKITSKITSKIASKTDSKTNSKTNSILGGSVRPPISQSYRSVSEAKGSHVRVYALWKRLKERVTIDRNVSVEVVRRDPERYVMAFSQLADWKETDAEMALIAELGMKAVIEVGEGTFQGLPIVENIDEFVFENGHNSNINRNGYKYNNDKINNNGFFGNINNVNNIRNANKDVNIKNKITDVKDFRSRKFNHIQNHNNNNNNNGYTNVIDVANDDDDDDDHHIADPSIIGEAVYLGYQYIVARSVAERYISKYPGNIAIFQLENELNEAWLAGIAGQRLFKAFRSPWRNWIFLTECLKTLKIAVDDALEGVNRLTNRHHRFYNSNNDSIFIPVTTNLHTDVPRSVHELLFLDGYYKDASRDWSAYLDYISFDMYPDMYSPLKPNRSEIVIERSTSISDYSNKDISKVFIMETGFPVKSPTVNNSVPFIGNFSDKSQAEYVESTCEAARNIGLAGYMYFYISESQGISPPVGGYTSEDILGLQHIYNIASGKHVIESIGWLAENRKWVSQRFTKEFKIGNAWGIVGRPAFNALRDCFVKWRS